MNEPARLGRREFLAGTTGLLTAGLFVSERDAGLNAGEQEPADRFVVQSQKLPALLSVTTFWTFLREFSPLEVCGDGIRNVRLIRSRVPGGGGQPKHVVPDMQAADIDRREFKRSVHPTGVLQVQRD